MIRLHVVKMKMQHNLLSPFKDINALHVTNNIVLLIIFMIVRMLYKSSCLTNHFQDVTKQGPLLLCRHLPASLLIHRVQTSLQIHVRIIWHLIHFCQSRLPDFSNPLKSLHLLHYHVVIRGIVRLDGKHAVLEQQYGIGMSSVTKLFLEDHMSKSTVQKTVNSLQGKGMTTQEEMMLIRELSTLSVMC